MKNFVRVFNNHRFTHPLPLSNISPPALVQPYESTLLNVLDVGSLLVLVFTQVLSICYLYLDNLQSLPSGLDHADVEITITIMLFVANIAVIVVLIIAWIGRLAYEKFTTTKRKVDEAGRIRAGTPRGSAIEMSTPPGRLNPIPSLASTVNPIALAQARLGDGAVVEEGDEEEGAGAVVTVSAAELKISELEAEVKEVNLEVTRLKEENAQLKLKAEMHGTVTELNIAEAEEDVEASMRPESESMHKLFNESMQSLFTTDLAASFRGSDGGGSSAGGADGEEDEEQIAGWEQHPARSGESCTI